MNPTVDQQASPSLLTDQYELTMLGSFIADGTARNPAVFEAFARRLPAGRRYGIVAGIGRLLPLIEAFRFDTDEVDWLLAEGVISAATADYLSDFRFTGDIDGLREGDPYFPNTPVLTVRGTLGECVLLETLILSVLNFDSAIASAAARMVAAAGDRPLIEMGSRRVHEQAAVAAARAAYVAGFAYTSNLAAKRIHGIPTTGTAAHAFTLAHDSEIEAFRSQIRTHGAQTTLLVDTYDIEQGIRNAVQAASEVGAPGPGAIRIDSGDLADEARKARILLDSLGATDTRITVTSDLDEYEITRLSDAPVDGYGAGTRVATGSGHPTAGFVYKLVAIGTDADPRAPMRPVAKKASGKASVGGRKWVWRVYDKPRTDGGTLTREIHAIENTSVITGSGEFAHAATEPLMRAGLAVHAPTLASIRLHTQHTLASLPDGALDVTDGTTAIVPEVAYSDYAVPVPVTSPLPIPVLQEA